MAKTTLSVQTISKSGLTDPTFSAANADGHDVANGGRMFLYVKNGGGSDCEVTVTTPGTVDGNAISDLVVDVEDGTEEVIGPFKPSVYNEDPGQTDTIEVLFEQVTSVTVAAFVLPAA